MCFNFYHSSLSQYSWYINIHLHSYLFPHLMYCYLYSMRILKSIIILPLLLFKVFHVLIFCALSFILSIWYFYFVTQIYCFTCFISIVSFYLFLFILFYFILFYCILFYFITDQTPLSFQLLSEMKDAKRSISDIKFSPDGSTLGVAARDNSIYLYSTAQQFKKRAVFSKHNAGINQFDFSKDGKSIQSCCGWAMIC